MECLKGYCAYFFFLFLHTIPSWLRVRNYDTTNDSTDEAGCNMRAILGCTKDTAAAAMRYVLGYPQRGPYTLHNKIGRVVNTQTIVEDMRTEL